ncbi:alpha/beta hydrolase [Rubinisphaera margarita]|uniref:alpha/beta hydrolase n=1 Tax=Rubinisphaera margarita TaxID=2909586 RepID=UPI001EE960F0|nr:alpha/beta hydrolase [Rubinisphaera margarita]MCG6154987.1 alpha/beta hydrolase [Rubinisphaera margarita]
MKKSVLLAVLLACSMTSQPTIAAPPLKDITFATVNSHELKLDLYLPKDATDPPLVVFIHGGGWRNGSHKRCLTPWLTDHGFAVASISYRLTDKAVFPAQVHDCKAAVRWLREHAGEYGYNAKRIGVAGTSAGGYLAVFLGVTGGDEEFEGTVGGNLAQDSTVQAVVDYYGPTDFVLRSKNQPHKTEKPDSPVGLLLGTPASADLDLARRASPAFHVSDEAAPLLIIHGDQDKTVYLDQSQRLEEEYRTLDLDVTLEVVEGGGHGGDAHFTKAYRDKVAKFLETHLKAAK